MQGKNSSVNNCTASPFCIFVFSSGGLHISCRVCIFISCRVCFFSRFCNFRGFGSCGACIFLLLVAFGSFSCSFSRFYNSVCLFLVAFVFVFFPVALSCYFSRFYNLRGFISCRGFDFKLNYLALVNQTYAALLILFVVAGGSLGLKVSEIDPLKIGPFRGLKR